MLINSTFIKFLACIFCLVSFMSCTTDDILPTLDISSSSDSLSEANGEVTVTATINTATSKDIIIPLEINGDASKGEDYTASADAITISSGQVSGNILLSGIQDQSIEGTETISISLSDGTNYLVLSGSSIEVAILDDDSDTDNDGVLDAEDKCPNEFGPPENNGCPFLGFLINEVLYDPPPGDAGDANGDGTRSPLQDEFIEFFNSGPELDLSGYTISDADQIRHVFPPNSIVPVNGVLLVFGGGSPTGIFGGAIIQTASEGQLNMSNSGDLVTLADPMGNPVLTFDIEPLSNNPDEAYSRNPDLTGEFEQHSGVEGANDSLFSPGTKLDGSAF